ncbi:MAG: DUF2085 domain-containing protein [Coriobacteriia bacterium]|nr:DUF2085 domain-containing protein [Coriobacteriia bacterium]
MLEEFLQWLGYGLCHQLPERSFFGGGVQVPVCARDTGIYVGFIVSFVVLAALHRHRPRIFPGTVGWVVTAAAVAFMGWDGLTSYAGVRETTNLLRLTSGWGVGYVCAALILPMLNDVLWAKPSAERLLDPWWRLAVWLVSAGAAVPLLWRFGSRLGVGYPILVVFAILGTLTAINLVIVGMFPAFDRAAHRYRDLVVPSAIAFGLAVLEVWIAGVGRGLLEAAARSVG